MERLRLLGLAALLALIAAPPAAAQMEDSGFQVSPRVSYYLYDNATPFKEAFGVGADARYFFNENLGLGFDIDFARPEVDGSYFPLAYFVYPGPSALLISAGQQATQLTYSLFAVAGIKFGQLALRVQGGGGLYTFYYDPMVIGSNPTRTGTETLTKPLAAIGAGLEWNLSEAAGFRLDVLDDIFFEFNRELFNPVEEGWQNLRTREDGAAGLAFPEANGTPPEAKETVHNFRISLAFQLMPGQIFR